MILGSGRRISVGGRVLGLAISTVLAFFGGCQGLNPSFLGFIGVSPINSLEDPPGSVVVVLINRTAFPAEMQLQVSEADGFVGTDELRAPANDFFITATDCEISQITFESVTVDLSSTGGDQTEVVVPESPLVGGFNFRCGNVVSVTVSGTADNFTLGVQIL